jgi:hypothetical protein
MSDQDDQPDHTEDPRTQSTGSGGYPESTHEGTEGDQRGGPEGDGESEESKRAPDTSNDKESDREHSTGNPGAAG